MSYLDRLKRKIGEDVPRGEATKGTKAPYVPYVASLPAPPRQISEQFEFSPPADPANDDEALAERAAIIAEGCGMDQAQALQEARWHADRERCWRAFLRNAERILKASRGRRESLHADYQAEATQRYGEATARDMAASMRSWIAAKAVH
jgi:hypothetical protein